MKGAVPIMAELGWEPTISFDEGMREFAAAPLRGEPG
jgi:dTDP-L-rhamnose 4-epimerase